MYLILKSWKPSLFLLPKHYKINHRKLGDLFNTTEIYSVIVTEARSQNEGMSQSPAPSEGWGKNSVTSLSLASGGGLQSLASLGL